MHSPNYYVCHQIRRITIPGNRVPTKNIYVVLTATIKGEVDDKKYIMHN